MPAMQATTRQRTVSRSGRPPRGSCPGRLYSTNKKIRLTRLRATFGWRKRCLTWVSFSSSHACTSSSWLSMSFLARTRSSRRNSSDWRPFSTFSRDWVSCSWCSNCKSMSSTMPQQVRRAVPIASSTHARRASCSTSNALEHFLELLLDLARDIRLEQETSVLLSHRRRRPTKQ